MSVIFVVGFMLKKSVKYIRRYCSVTWAAAAVSSGDGAPIGKVYVALKGVTETSTLGPGDVVGVKAGCNVGDRPWGGAVPLVCRDLDGWKVALCEFGCNVGSTGLERAVGFSVFGLVGPSVAKGCEVGMVGIDRTVGAAEAEAVGDSETTGRRVGFLAEGVTVEEGIIEIAGWPEVCGFDILT